MEPTTEETFDDDGILREPGLRLLRSLSLGSAGASFIVIMSLFQMNKSSDALSWVLYGAVLAMPLFLLSVTAYQIYLMGGAKSYPHMQTSIGSFMIIIPFSIGAFSLVFSVICLVYAFDCKAFAVLLLSSIVAISVNSYFRRDLTKFIEKIKG